MAWWRRRTTVDTETLERLDRMERALRRLCDDVDDIDTKLVKVRGLVYAKKIHRTGLPDDGEAPGAANGAATDKMSRQELKAYLTRSGRFTPGQPPKHQE